MKSRNNGLTLIEVMAVVALIGIIAGATAWSMAGNVRRTGEQAIIAQIQNADRMARIAGQRLSGRSVLRIDLDRQRMERLQIDENEGETRVHTVSWPKDIRIDRVMLPGRMQDSGEVQIAYSSEGHSVSYGLWISLDHKETWLVFAGLTGQMVRANDQTTVDKLFENLAAGWDDAD